MNSTRVFSSSVARPLGSVSKTPALVRLIAALGLAICSGRAAFGQRSPTQEWAEAREAMVQRDLIEAGIKNEQVIEAIRKTPRHEFMPINKQKLAYYDMAVPIGEKQTISPAFVVAFMTEQLDPQPTDKVLEIGTGSGYQAAVLSGLVHEVYTIEIVEKLGKRARAVFDKLDYKNVVSKIGDGFQGWPEHAPFDKIIVTCSPEDIPQPLIDQLAEGGRMVIPVGERFHQALYLYVKKDGKVERTALEPTMFVPMTGQAEDSRRVKPDPARPELVNGGFEETGEFENRPDGWYYLRQAQLEDDPKCPEGKRSLVFRNETLGRNCMALQAFTADGRVLKRATISAWTRYARCRPSSEDESGPGMVVHLFDENRQEIGYKSLAPWSGDSDWREESLAFDIPPRARLAVLAIGCLGGTGEVAFDLLSVEGETRKPPAKK